MKVQLDPKPIFYFAMAFAVSAAVALAVLVVVPDEIGLSLDEVADHIVLILVCYVFGVLCVSIWRGWVRFGS